MHELKTIAVIGGTGHFGDRICRRLSSEADIKLIVTSRSEVLAGEFVSELKSDFPGATIHPAALDQFSADFVNDLGNLNPDIVIHTAGPYQGQDYRVAKACIECGSHYIDLADGREFVSGFTALNGDALKSDVLLVSGASTLPGLSSAVVDAVRDRFAELSEIEISIAPAHQTPRGTSTISAVLSYCGRPYDVLKNGEWVTTFGWQDLQLQNYPSLGRRLSGACDVPDLSLLPQYVPGVKTVTFHAALEAVWEQLTLYTMAWFTRLGVVGNWNRFVTAFSWMSDRMIRLGSQTGGMHVRISGIDNNHCTNSCTWYLTANNNHGPEIPCSPALILARKLLRDGISERGAHACLGLITLTEFDEEVKDLDISWEIVE